MHFNEEELLKKYEMAIQKNEILMPNNDFVRFCKNMSNQIKNSIYSEEENKSEKMENLKSKTKAIYIEAMAKSFIKFGESINSNELTINDFPVKDWFYLAESEETRFALPDFHSLTADAIKSLSVKNYNLFVYALKNTRPDDISKILANFESPEMLCDFTRDLNNVYPEIVSSPYFTPLTDIINEGNYRLLERVLVNREIDDFKRNGKLKDFEILGVETNIILRLNSDYDLIKKKNIVKALCVASENRILDSHLKDLGSKNKARYSSILNIPVDKKLSYADIYLFSQSNVPLFENNNQRLIDMKKIQDEKLKCSPEKQYTKMNNKI